MKKLITIFSLLALMVVAGPPRGTVLLVWEYPPDEMSTNLTFVVYHSDQISRPVTLWPVLTNVVGTNLSVRIPAIPGKNFFTMKATNQFDESDFSTVASCVMPRSDVNLRIEK